MPTKKLADLAVKIGTYEKDGQPKGRYVNIGAVMDGDNGQYLLIDRHFNPAGVPNPDNKNSILVSVFYTDKEGG